MEASVALRHVFNARDTENQWRRAVVALSKMTELERAQAWKLFSSDNLKLESSAAIITHSQYKTLFKHALREAVGPKEQIGVCASDTGGEEIMSTLKHYIDMLEEYKFFLATFTVSFNIDGEDATAPKLIHQVDTDQISLAFESGKREIKKLHELIEQSEQRIKDHITPIIKSEITPIIKSEIQIHQDGIKNEIQKQIATLNTSTVEDIRNLKKIIDEMKNTIEKDIEEILNKQALAINSNISSTTEKQTIVLKEAQITASQNNEKVITDEIKTLKTTITDELKMFNELSACVEQTLQTIQEHGVTLKNQTQKLKDAMSVEDDIIKHNTEQSTDYANLRIEFAQVKQSIENLNQNMQKLLDASLEIKEEHPHSSHVDEGHIPSVSTTVESMNRTIITNQTEDEIAKKGFHYHDRFIVFNYNPINGAKKLRLMNFNDTQKIYGKDDTYQNYTSHNAMIAEVKTTGLPVYQNDESSDTVVQSIAENGYIKDGRRRWCTFNPVTGTRRFNKLTDKPRMKDKMYPQYITKEAMVREIRHQPQED